MKKRIEDFSNNLITEQGYAGIYDIMPRGSGGSDFVRAVQEDLSSRVLTSMPLTELVPILEELEDFEENMGVKRDTIISYLTIPHHHYPPVKGIFRDLVATFLAIVIQQRLDGTAEVPPYIRS